MRGGHILAVDDHEAKRYAWQRILTRAGFSVVTASTGTEALALSKQNPELIILDVRLPDINGTDVCRMIKKEPATSSIPILHISASLVTSEDRTAALEGGADGYLTEPVDPEELVASVKALLRMRRAEDEARRAADEWKKTFDTIQDSIVVADARQTITRCNRGFLDLVKLPAEQVQGANLRDLLVNRLHLAKVERLEEVATRRIRQTEEVRSGDRWLRVTLDPVLRSGDYDGCICLLSDVTERIQAEQEVKAGREELRQLNSSLELRVTERTQRLQSAIRELEAYSYTIAHDLRAPLRAIHRFSEILVDEYAPKLDAEAQDYARRIIDGAEKMDGLINDLLEYSRLTQSELKLQQLQPGEILGDVTRGFLSDSSAAVPEIDVDPNLPEVYADRLLLSQVFQNLISNALKFVKGGVRPSVRIRGERRDDQIVLSVIDNGIGIAPQAASRLFRVFERLGDVREYPGTGIGLAIVRRAMERMNGECGVESEPGRGSRFWIRLPAVGAASSESP